MSNNLLGNVGRFMVSHIECQLGAVPCLNEAELHRRRVATPPLGYKELLRRPHLSILSSAVFLPFLFD